MEREDRNIDENYKDSMDGEDAENIEDPKHRTRKCMVEVPTTKYVTPAEVRSMIAKEV